MLQHIEGVRVKTQKHSAGLGCKLRPHTADDVALVVLLPLPYVQQQVGAVRVGPVSRQGAHRRLFFQLLVVGVQV